MSIFYPTDYFSIDASTSRNDWTRSISETGNSSAPPAHLPLFAHISVPLERSNSGARPLAPLEPPNQSAAPWSPSSPARWATTCASVVMIVALGAGLVGGALLAVALSEHLVRQRRSRNPIYFFIVSTTINDLLNLISTQVWVASVRVRTEHVDYS